MTRKTNTRHQLSLMKKIGFSVLTFFLVAVLFETALSVLGIGSPQDEDAYAGFAKSVPLFVKTRDASGQTFYETSTKKKRFFNEQRFAETKTEGARRLFCIGGSTTYGRPFDDSTSFCGWIRGFLAQVDPEREWEVVNAGGISYASYRAAAVMKEIAEYEPDVFVIYSGHNEFLEKRTWSQVLSLPEWLREADALLRRTRSYTLVGQVAKRLQAGDQIPGEVDALLDNTVGLDAYERDPGLTARVLEEYQLNLQNMVRTARLAGAEPILVVPASNTKDCSPFKSEFDPALEATLRKRWRAHFERGRKAFLSEDPITAQAELESAVRIDPSRADGQYWLGRTLLELENETEAMAHLLRARKEDVCPLRALDTMVERVRGVAQSESVTLVDYPAVLSAHAGQPFGEELFLDHVHPTIEAHGLLGLAIVNALHSASWVPRRAEAQDFEAVEHGIRDNLDPERQGRALRNLAKVLSWSGKIDDAARAARSALELLGTDAECEFILGDSETDRGDFEAAIEHYQAAIELESDYTKALNNMGIALSRVGRPNEAITAYQRVLELKPQHRGARFNLANAYLRAGLFEEAAVRYGDIVNANWSDLDAHFNLARAHYGQGKLELAEDHLRVVLDEDPEAQDARQELQLVLNERDRHMLP